tara:strand:+ start:5542 stop:5811 length:270 start_codon:yes stop_codon:yes gene_type:complete
MHASILSHPQGKLLLMLLLLNEYIVLKICVYKKSLPVREGLSLCRRILITNYKLPNFDELLFIKLLKALLLLNDLIVSLFDAAKLEKFF